MIRLGYEKGGQQFLHDISAFVRIENHGGDRTPSVHIETAPVFIQFLISQLGGISLHTIMKVEPYEEKPKDEILLCSHEHDPLPITAFIMADARIPDHLIHLIFERDRVRS